MLTLRVLVTALCIVVAGSDIAAAEDGGSAPYSGLLRVSDPESPLGWRPTQAECQRYPNWAPNEACRRFNRLGERDRQERPSPQTAARLDQPRSGRPALLKSAVAAADRQRREPAQSSEPVKPLPLKLAASRRDDNQPSNLREMVGQLLIEGFSGKRVSDPGISQAASELQDGRLSGIVISAANVESCQQFRELVALLSRSSDKFRPFLVFDNVRIAARSRCPRNGFEDAGSRPFAAPQTHTGIASEPATAGVVLEMSPREGDSITGRTPALSDACSGISISESLSQASALSADAHPRAVLSALRANHFSPPRAHPCPLSRAAAAMLYALVKNEVNDAVIIHAKATQPIILDAASVPFALRNAALAPIVDGRLRIVDLDIGPRGSPLRFGEAVIRALQAGADVVLLSDASTLPASATALTFDAVRTAVQSGRLAMSRVENAFQRVQRLKGTLRATQPSIDVLRFSQK